MKFHNLKRRREPLNLSEALVLFGMLRDDPTQWARECSRLGQRLVREIQYLHGLLEEIRATLPDNYDGYTDPQRVDTALARTTVRP